MKKSSPSDHVGHSLFTILNSRFIPLVLSLVMLSCKDGPDPDKSSRQQENSPGDSGIAGHNSAARSSKVSENRATPATAAQREKAHKEAMRKAAMDSQGSDPAAEKAFNKALQDWVNDPVLHGERRYASADQVKDEKVSYHLPEKATTIQLLKQANGHYALYKISEEDFKAHMVMVWERYRKEYVKGGGKHWIKQSDEEVRRNLMSRNVGRLIFTGPTPKRKAAAQSTDRKLDADPSSGVYATLEEQAASGNKPKTRQVRVPQEIIDAGWKALENAAEYQGPRRSNGGGATYYYDRESGYAFHDVGYW